MCVLIGVCAKSAIHSDSKSMNVILGVGFISFVIKSRSPILNCFCLFVSYFVISKSPSTQGNVQGHVDLLFSAERTNGQYPDCIHTYTDGFVFKGTVIGNMFTMRGKVLQISQNSINSCIVLRLWQNMGQLSKMGRVGNCLYCLGGHMDRQKVLVGFFLSPTSLSLCTCSPS